MVRGSALSLLVLGLVSPASADWLVTRRGESIETQGAWQIKGNQVVFTRTNGTLSALKLAEIDLEASRLATEKEKNPPPPPPPPPPPKKPVLVLTDADIPKAAPAPPPVAGAEPTASAAAPTAGLDRALEVTSWQQMEDRSTPDVQLLGTLRNSGSEVAGEVQLRVRLLNGKGETVGETDALLGTTSLGAGKATNFRALFPGVYAFTTVQFEAKSGLRLAPAPPPAETADGPISR